LSEFNAGLNYTGLIGDTSLQYQFSSASFEGSIFGSTIDNDLSGSGTFETEAITHDVVIMTKWGLGFGYRSFSYDLPQDIYMVKESEPNTLLLKQFTNMEYQVDFYQIVFEKNALLKESLSNFNLGIKARYGLGTMDAFSQAAVQMEQELADLGRNVEGGLLGDGDVSFIEYEIFGYMPLVRSQSITADIKLGYRNKVLSAKFENSSAYKFVTDFETEFSGPYATLNFIW